MATNNFSVFAENSENILTPNDYTNNEQRINGVQSGLASSAVQNTSLKQVSAMTKALADLMVSKGQDADYTQPSELSNNLQATLEPLVLTFTRGALNTDGLSYSGTMDASYAEAYAAYNAGRDVIVKYQNRTHRLVLANAAFMEFMCVLTPNNIRFPKLYGWNYVIAFRNNEACFYMENQNYYAYGDAYYNTLTLVESPTENMQAATKQYVDNTVQNSGNVSLVEYTSSGSFTFDSSATPVSTATKIPLPSNFAALASVKNLALFFAVEGQSSSSNTMNYGFQFFDAAGNRIINLSASKEYEGRRGGTVYINLMNGYFLWSTSDVGTQAIINTRTGKIDFSNCSYMTVSNSAYSSTTTSTVTASIVGF